MTSAPSTSKPLLVQIYDCYRNALFSRKYYAARLARVQRQSRATEILLALATSGAIGSWGVWHSSVGQWFWKIAAGAVVIVTVVKPILNWQADVERYTGLYLAFTGLFFDLNDLVNGISVHGGVTIEDEKRFRQAWMQYAKVCENGDPAPSRRLSRRCYDEVSHEIRADELWMPPEFTGDE
jgi:hypothetical protein